MRKRYENDFSVMDNFLHINETKSQTKYDKTDAYNLSSVYGIYMVVFFFGMYFLVAVIDGILPTPLKVIDEVEYPEDFITERAEHDLKLLTELGPRIAGGYENEVLAVDFFKREINFIIQQANRNQKIELDIQVVSGAYFLDGKPVGQINTYSNVHNIIVKIHSVNNSQHSVLVNTHFDSVPTSPGGSDDGINCVALLEILRKLSRSPIRPQHNIILLFNGAEETPLQAAHGFITQHKWAKECRVLINLEAAGAGGKIILFQTGPNVPWLMKYFKKLPYPCGQVAGEEIFQSGIIPSDTDFRVFRDFGGLIGLDMAFIKDGYRYHTKYDGFENIPLGSYQHVGANALVLIRELANAPELNEDIDQNQSENVVYFDVFGLFMVSYTTSTAKILNSIVALVSIILSCSVFTKQNWKYTFLSVGAILLSWIGAPAITFVIAITLDGLNLTMRWYGTPSLILGLYFIPCLSVLSLAIVLLRNKNYSINFRCHTHAHSVRLLWTALLIVGTIFNVRSSYAVLIPVLFNCLAFVIIKCFKWENTVNIWRIIYIAFLTIPSMLLLYQEHVTLSLFIPITGRIGSNRNPEIVVGLITTLFTILIASPYVILINCFKDYKYYVNFLGSLFAITLLITCTPLSFPYSGAANSPTPQRHWILHTGRTFHDSNGNVTQRDAGIFFINLDRNSPNYLKNYIGDLKKAVPIDCDKYVLCGLPLPHVKILQIIKESTWIPANQPVIHNPLKFVVNSKEMISTSTIRYNITVSGPDRLAIYIMPKNDTNVSRFNLVDNLPEHNYLFNGRQIYYIWHTFGTQNNFFNFNFDVNVPENWNGTTTVDIAAAAIYVHEERNPKTPYFLNIIRQFPNWADVTPMLGTYTSWII